MMRQLGANILIIIQVTQFILASDCSVARDHQRFRCLKTKVVNVNILNYQPRIGRVQGPSLSTENPFIFGTNTN